MGALAKITAKGQITLPKQVRERYRLKVGDHVEFVEQDGKIWVRPRNVRAVDLVGILGPPPSGPRTLEEIDEGIAEAAADHAARRWK